MKGRCCVTAVVLLIGALSLFVASASAEPMPVVVASGLDNPRHLTFGDEGELYVVEAGRGGAGPCVSPYPALGTACLGSSGAVTKVRDSGPDERVLTGLPSITGSGLTLGPSDIAFTESKKFVLSVGLGSDPTLRAQFGPGGALLGTLVTGKLKQGGFSLFADVAANEAAANPDGTDIDSNPTGLLRQGERYIVADSGGNAVVRASGNGTFTTIAALPPTGIGADAVPTSVVRGPDRAFYISQLTGFPFTVGAANIWRVVPGQAPTIYASGLTNVTDLAFASDGTLYAVEIASQGLASGPPIGALVRIPRGGGSQHTTVLGGLFAPYGVALTGGEEEDENDEDEDEGGVRAAYVTTCAVCVGGGQVIKIPLPRGERDDDD